MNDASAQTTGAGAVDRWLGAGVPVFPCGPADKTPICKTWRPKDPHVDKTRPLTLENSQSRASVLCRSEVPKSRQSDSREQSSRNLLAANYGDVAQEQANQDVGGRNYYACRRS
jgi:hypothetical protein